MNRYSITKYNPANRNDNGHYLVDEWTCPSEVGKIFNGLMFKDTDYFAIESKYVNAVIKILKSRSISSLRIVNLSTDYMNKFFLDPSFQWLMACKFKEIELYEDKSVHISEIEIIIRMILRNFIDCSLEIDGVFKLFFGYDFYMNLNISYCDKNVFDEIEASGLFVDCFGSTPHEINYEFTIQYGRKTQEFIEEEILLTNITRENIRAGLGYSVEHPCNHSFKINKSNCSIFSDIIEFDFENNDYSLCCDFEWGS